MSLITLINIIELDNGNCVNGRRPFLECIPLLVSSASITCLKAVMSRNVNKSNTTKSRSLRIGATWSRSHNGVSGRKRKTTKKKKHNFVNDWQHSIFSFKHKREKCEIFRVKRFPFWLKRSNAIWNRISKSVLLLLLWMCKKNMKSLYNIWIEVHGNRFRLAWANRMNFSNLFWLNKRSLFVVPLPWKKHQHLVDTSMKCYCCFLLSNTNNEYIIQYPSFQCSILILSVSFLLSSIDESFPIDNVFRTQYFNEVSPFVWRLYWMPFHFIFDIKKVFSIIKAFRIK